jgi:hypothetical protein
MMFDDWHEYFFMIGSSAAALIGLMFVVVTLTAGSDRRDTERGKHLYTSPIVWHLGVVLLLSGCAIAPTIGPRFFGAIAGAAALLGIAMCCRNAVGIARTRISGAENANFDTWWYGIVPALAYVGLASAAVGALISAAWAASAVAAALMALLLLSIHGEWDLVTFLAPRAPASAERPEK